MPTVRHTRLAAVLLGCVCLAACQSRFFPPPRWTVALSPLDSVEILYSATDAGNTNGVQMSQITVLGTGYVNYRAGSSPRVATDFWGERTGAQWDQYRTDTVTMPGPYIQACFQHLVDLGFFDDNVFEDEDREERPHGVLVVATINGRKKARYTHDERVFDMVRELLRQF